MKQSKLPMSGGFGSLAIMLLAAVAVIGLIAIFVFSPTGSSVKRKTGQEITAEDHRLQQLTTLSSSDEIGDIETELNTTNLDSIDEEMPQIEKETSTL